jgi:hypothetical protein
MVRLAIPLDDELELLDDELELLDDELELLDDELELLDDELELFDDELDTVDPEEELELLVVPPAGLPEGFPPQAASMALVSNGRINLQVWLFNIAAP